MAEGLQSAVAAGLVVLMLDCRFYHVFPTGHHTLVLLGIVTDQHFDDIAPDKAKT